MKEYKVDDKVKVISKSVSSNWSEVFRDKEGIILEIRQYDHQYNNKKYYVVHFVTIGAYHFLECDFEDNIMNKMDDDLFEI